GDRGADRLQIPGRQGDDQPLDLAPVAPLELAGDGIDIPGWLIGLSRRHRLKRSVNEAAEVAAQDKIKSGAIDGGHGAALFSPFGTAFGLEGACAPFGRSRMRLA